MASSTLGEAIFAMWNVSAITDVATGGLHRNLAPQRTERPFGVITLLFSTPIEYTFTEKVCDDYRVQLDFYAEDTEDATGDEIVDSLQAKAEEIAFDNPLEITGKATLYCRKQMSLPAPSSFDGMIRIHRSSAQYRMVTQ
jgi:hypothetical protein